MSAVGGDLFNFSFAFNGVRVAVEIAGNIIRHMTTCQLDTAHIDNTISTVFAANFDARMLAFVVKAHAWLRANYLAMG
jgi:hypothetical protein